MKTKLFKSLTLIKKHQNKSGQTVNSLPCRWKTIFWTTIMFWPFSQAQSINCRDVFSSPLSPLTFSEAVSKNLLLRENQISLLESYIKLNFKTNYLGFKKNYYNENNYERKIQNLFSILEQHPELSKPVLREYQLVFLEKNNPSSHLKRKEFLRLRPLSLQESFFQDLLQNRYGGWTDNAILNPNYLYFTLTDNKHHSHGLVTIVLGQARENNSKVLNVAFVDKIEAIPSEKVIAVLEGIRLSLKEEGYKLALPKDVGNPIDGLSSTVNEYIENKILPNLKTELLEFKPPKHKYNFREDTFSRANRTLPLLEFDQYKSSNSIEIRSGKKYPPTIADKDLSLKSLYQPILSMKNSEKEGEQTLFLKNLLMMRNLKELKISNKYVENHLSSVLKNSKLSLKLRKRAFFTLIQFEVSKFVSFLSEVQSAFPFMNKPTNFLSFLVIQMIHFSEKERTLILEEMSTWKNSSESYKRSFISYLHSSALKGGVVGLEILANNPWKVLFDVNTKDYQTRISLLQESIYNVNEYIEEFQWLIKKGADVNAVDKGKKTALMSTAIQGHFRIFMELIKKKANINAVDGYGRTALMQAVRYGHLDKEKMFQYEKIIIELIKRGANINAVDKDGNNALMIAAREGNILAIKILIVEAKADVDMKNNSGETALMIAKQNGHSDIVTLLIRAEAEAEFKELPETLNDHSDTK